MYKRYVQPVFETLRTVCEAPHPGPTANDVNSPFYLTISMFHRATHCHEDSGLLTGTLLMRKLVLRCFIMERREKGKGIAREKSFILPPARSLGKVRCRYLRGHVLLLCVCDVCVMPYGFPYWNP